MKKFTSKTLTMSLVIAMLLAVLMAFSGCGGQPANLEEYIEGNAEAQEQIEKAQETAENSGLELTIEENTILYTHQYPTTYEPDVAAAMSAQLEESFASFESMFTSLSDQMKEETGIDDIVVRVLVLNGDGSEMYSVDY
ncbi:MAG: DUF4854 domain-containing protein [Bacillota bacterium]|nr:DUF4854 domain-containing protein [Bacillota bacterium]